MTPWTLRTVRAGLVISGSSVRIREVAVKASVNHEIKKKYYFGFPVRRSLIKRPSLCLRYKSLFMLNLNYVKILNESN